jgi:Ni,Fe-hydrogenase III small subunit
MHLVVFDGVVKCMLICDTTEINCLKIIRCVTSKKFQISRLGVFVCSNNIVQFFYNIIVTGVVTQCTKNRLNNCILKQQVSKRNELLFFNEKCSNRSAL